MDHWMVLIVSSKVINTQSLPQTDKKTYYTDNQFLFEHIIELNNKVNKLMNKHKKFKRKYQSLQNDFYIDEDDFESVKCTPSNSAYSMIISLPVCSYCRHLSKNP